MTTQFLRDEAARFRGMADDADRDATKMRLLAMAADYENRARRADELITPYSGEATFAVTEPNLAEAIDDVIEPRSDEVIKVRPGKKIAREMKETVVVQRGPVARQR